MTHLLRASRTDLSSSTGVKDADKVVLLCTPVMQGLVDEIFDGEWRSYFQRCNIQWKSFEDGFPNIFIEHIDRLRGRDVVFFASFLEHAKLFEQLSVLYALPRYMVKSLIVVLPYFPTGTMERVDHEGQVGLLSDPPTMAQIATASTMTRLLSNIPISAGGPSKVIIYDIHALQNRFYFSDAAIPLMVSALPIFLDILLSEFKDKSIAIAFPDDGANKRFGKLFERETLEIIICIKKRTSAGGRVVTIKDGNPVGKHVFIVDDLVKTGGTLIQCKDALFAAGASDVSAYVTHGVFPEESWRRFTTPAEKGKGFSNFYITNSCPVMAETLKDVEPFRVLSLARDIVDTILRY